MAEMLSAIHTGPWNKPLDWSLNVTQDGEPRVLFSRSVQSGLASFPHAIFSLFGKLPTELQLDVLRFCDRPTLFQLMHVSSTMRIEARKLFWSDPDVWYHVDAPWLLAGGFPGPAYHAMNILPYVEQIEVEFDHMTSVLHDSEPSIGEAQSASSWVIEKRICDLWRTLRRRFPRVTHVVVSESHPRGAEHTPPCELKMVVQMCPLGVTVSASILQRDDVSCLLERNLWRLAGDASVAGEWEMVYPDWRRQSIILPPKEFRGLVGAYQHIDYQFQRFCSRKWAIPLLLIEARERHHFDERCEPFRCFEPTCVIGFERAGKWALHAMRTRHDEKGQGTIPPEEFRHRFEQHEAELRRMRKRDIEGALEKMLRDWSEKTSEEQLGAEQAFLHQLDHDPLYAHGRPAQESLTWLTYIREMEPKRN
ncbi:hypothetical protein P153DRAFT_363154 [Dothidotthia symphoricarpi CBS 119687]|uniref:Uncharacterized protein n=1 Tax=Dothidotthia symphoricarpi CBS 119687 TaxID=1392245 RepID=A0A6A6AQU9_9PLEO|nr:uncharacterized protein P153DRAFT_363154 [Dothidotthia symphoricarpi CBS 119687]KAF2134170.1 hypothetical protein P153DRAFT_363154 [Dothidotthia symphoricarpi CBS 119687]